MFDEFFDAYIETALWSSMDDNGTPLDKNYNRKDISPNTLAEMERDCTNFLESFGHLVIEDVERAGHDFWLTRNRHGAGFWDGDWNEPFMDERYKTVGDYLTAMSHTYGEYCLYVGDDGKIYGS